MAYRSRPLSLIYQGRVMMGIQIAALFRYKSDPGATPAELKIYGIDKSGENLIGTISLVYAADNEWTADKYVSLTHGEFLSVIIELDASSTPEFVALKEVEMIGFVQSLSDTGTAIV